MRAPQISVSLLCLVAAAISSAAAAVVVVAGVPSDQFATSTEPSSVSVVSLPTEAEARSAHPAAASSRQTHRVRPLQRSHALQWAGVGTPPTLWRVPQPPVTPSWRFEPGISSGSNYWPNIMHAMGGHRQQTASDKPAAKAATTDVNATREAHGRAAAGTTDPKISRLNALTSNTYQSSASPVAAAAVALAAGSDWTPTQLARPAAAAARLAADPDASGVETITQGPDVVTSTEATARRGQPASGWLRVFSFQPQSEPAGQRTARRHDQPDTAGEDLRGAETRRQLTDHGPRPHPSQQYRAEYVSEPLGSGVVIAGPPQFSAHELQTAPSFRPGRRQPPRRGFVDNMMSRLFGSSSPRPQRQRPPSFPRQPAPQQQIPHHFQQQQQDNFQQQQRHGNFQQQNNFQQQENDLQQQSKFQQQNSFKQQQQQPEPQQQQQQHGFQQQQQFGQQQFNEPEFTGQQFSRDDQFTPSVQDHGVSGVSGKTGHFRPLQLSPTKVQQPQQQPQQPQQPQQQQPQQQQQTHSVFSVASQLAGSGHSAPEPAAARPAPSRPTKSRPGVPTFKRTPSPVAAAESFEPARLPSVRQSLDDDPASRAAVLTAAYLRSPQTTERRDDGTMVVTGALLDNTVSDDVVELVIEYDSDLESIVDGLLREVRGGGGGGGDDQAAAVEQEPPAPAASQLRRRPFTVQQLDQRLGLAHQPYYHVAMALHGLTQGAGRRR